MFGGSQPETVLRCKNHPFASPLEGEADLFARARKGRWGVWAPPRNLLSQILTLPQGEGSDFYLPLGLEALEHGEGAFARGLIFLGRLKRCARRARVRIDGKTEFFEHRPRDVEL